MTPPAQYGTDAVVTTLRCVAIILRKNKAINPSFLGFLTKNSCYLRMFVLHL